MYPSLCILKSMYFLWIISGFNSPPPPQGVQTAPYGITGHQQRSSITRTYLHARVHLLRPLPHMPGDIAPSPLPPSLKICTRTSVRTTTDHDVFVTEILEFCIRIEHALERFMYRRFG